MLRPIAVAPRKFLSLGSDIPLKMGKKLNCQLKASKMVGKAPKALLNSKLCGSKLNPSATLPLLMKEKKLKNTTKRKIDMPITPNRLTNFSFSIFSIRLVGKSNTPARNIMNYLEASHDEPVYQTPITFVVVVPKTLGIG